MGSEPLVLLDTHALVWLPEASVQLGRTARRLADAALVNGLLAVSAISFWEIALLEQKGRIEAPRPVDRWRAELLARGLEEIAVGGDIGILAARLEHFHADPADRIIVATAASRGAVLLTADDRILRWRGSLRRQDARR